MPTDELTTRARLRYERRFTQEGQDPYETVEWGRRDARAGSGNDAFFQADVEAPVSWSDQSIGIVAKLYFATVDNVREDSVRQIISRVVGRFSQEGATYDYFTDEDNRAVFQDELTWLLLHQYVTFNTPVWLNIGVPGRRQCASACFLLAVEDNLGAIHNWWAEEGRIFKAGAGAGINVSNIRGSMESLSTGGTASGPVSYVRPSDAGAGTLKSGGAHRRAAKLVRLDADHPDVEDFVNCKVREDARMRALMEAGFNLDPMTPEGERNIAECTSFQNQNISVGVTDEFMRQATEHPEYTGWELTARVTGKTVETINASALLWRIADAAWRCADPGMQYHDTINAWHTTPSLGPISTSNPCGETMLNDDSSCNLGTLNVGAFIRDGTFLVDDFRAATDVMITAMDVTCSFGEFPTEKIAQNTRDLRQLGLGYTNMGATLMRLGLPYDSDEGRDFAASISALMTGRAYLRSAELAKTLGAFKHFEDNRDTMLAVIERHRDAVAPHLDENEIWNTACADWADALTAGCKYGYRNSQVTLVQPGGTTSFKVGADTTGIEPFFALVTYKDLAGGGTMKLVNGAVKDALDALGYDGKAKDVILTLERDGAEAFLQVIRPEHTSVFQTAAGADPIEPMAHVRMIAEVQPFLSQSISKTINLPESATVEDVRDAYVAGWRLGCKALSVYRDGSKATQVLRAAPEGLSPVQAQDPVPRRRKMPIERQSVTRKFVIDGHEGYYHVGKYDDGTLGEMFLSGLGKDGSTLMGMANAWATTLSVALQYGVPLEDLVRKYVNVAFPPAGMTNDVNVPFASSIPDYIGRALAARFLDADVCEELGVLTTEVKERKVAALDVGTVAPVPAGDVGHACKCGAMMQRSGTCWICSSCGASTGCG